MNKLFGFFGPNREDGYKKDGRGTWSTDGETTIRHSVDRLPNGQINEHVVTSKPDEPRHYASTTYTPSGGSWESVRKPCPNCGGYH